MENLATTISSNLYLQAFAIIATVVGALVFLWKNKSSIRSFFGSVLYFVAGKIWIPAEVTTNQINLSVRNSSFLIALLFKHSVSVFLCIAGWYFCRVFVEELGKIPEQTSLIDGVQGGFVFLLNVFTLVGGARVGEMHVITYGVMRRIKALAEEK